MLLSLPLRLIRSVVLSGSRGGLRHPTDLLAQAVIPVYSAYLAYTTFVAARGSMAGLGAGAGADGSAGTTSGQASGSKRQAKMEKRGGQKVQYR